MKKLLLLLLLASIGCQSQTQGNASIPFGFEGNWTNATGTDTINITSEKITWTSITENSVIVSYVDYILHTDPDFFSFYAYPNVYAVSLQKVSRSKLILHVQTPEGYTRADGIYLKQTLS